MKLKIGPYNENLERKISVGDRLFLEKRTPEGHLVFEVYHGPDDSRFVLKIGLYKYSYEAHSAVLEECEKEAGA